MRQPGPRLLPSAAALTFQIKRVATIKELLRTHGAHQANFNHIHLSACWTSLSKLARQTQAEQGWLQSNAQALDTLAQHTEDVAMAKEIDARELANVAHGAA